MESLARALEGYDAFLVTTRSPYSASVLPQMTRFYVRRLVRNPANFVVNFVQSVRILLREKPDAVVSTGAGDALPLMGIAIALGIPVIFLETMARVFTMSLTGRIVRRWVSVTLVQWRSLMVRYPGAISVNPMIHLSGSVHPLPSTPSIVVLTGTAERGFERLLRGVEQLIDEGRLPHTVFAQIGHSSYVPRNFSYERFLPHPRLITVIEASDLVITHDGAGSMREALSLAKPTLVMPRKSAEGELLYRSDFELAQRLAALGWIQIVEDPRELPEVIAHLSSAMPSAKLEEGKDVREVVDEFLGVLATAHHAVVGRTDQSHSSAIEGETLHPSEDLTRSHSTIRGERPGP